MTENNIPGVLVSSTLTAKASEDLQVKVQEELNVKDPTLEVAKATLDGNDSDEDIEDEDIKNEGIESENS